MVTKALLFPRSAYLSTYWWHRFAIVIFWLWFVFVLGYCWHAIVHSPFMSCINTKIQTELVLREPSELDCGSNEVAYFTQNLKSSSASEIVGGFVFFAVVLYIILALPGLLYRLVLYIAKGSDWKDVKASA